MVDAARRSVPQPLTMEAILSYAPVGLYAVVDSAGNQMTRESVEMLDFMTDEIKTGPAVLLARVREGKIPPGLPHGASITIRSDGKHVIQQWCAVDGRGRG